VNTNGIILESLWFKRRGKKPLIYSQESEVSEIEENVLSGGKNEDKRFLFIYPGKIES